MDDDDRPWKTELSLEVGVDTRGVGEAGGVPFVSLLAETEDSEEVILAVSSESTFPFTVDEIVSVIPGAVADDLFFAGRCGKSFPGNSSRN